MFQKTGVWLVLFVVGFGLFLAGCKDQEATFEAAQTEKCKILIDDQDWSGAIDACTALATDEGYRLAAQAYASRAGVAVIDIMVDLTGDDVNAAEVLLNAVPSTDSARSDMLSALNLLLNKIESPSSTAYLEAVVISGLLVFKELKTLLSLEVSGTSITTCAGDPADVSNCTFAPSVETTSTEVAGQFWDQPSSIKFVGLGTDFYDNLCSESTTQTDTINSLSAEVKNSITGSNETLTIAYNFTVNGCTIAANSVLDYNYRAFAGYEANPGFADATSLDVLNFTPKMDKGNNFAISISSGDFVQNQEIKFCIAGTIEPPTASDFVLNDCEILDYLQAPGF